MKETKIINQLNLIIMLCALCISIFLSSAEAKAATNGEIPCGDGGQVTWTLDENGVLTFSGTGTPNIAPARGGLKAFSDWGEYWKRVALNKEDVKSVKVAEGSKITLESCQYMFKDFIKCKEISLEGFDTSHTTTLSLMFWDCNSLTKLDLSSLNTSSVTDMSSMFNDCNSLKELDVSGFDTSKVTQMGSMFSSCSSLKELDVSGFDTSNVDLMYSMFSGCKELKELDVSGFHTGQVTNMSNMFQDCKKLKELDVSGFDTSKVTNMISMFNGCESVLELNVRGFKTGQVTDMSYMFNDCKQLKELDVSGFDTSKVTNMTSMFNGCESVLELNVRGFKTGQVTNMNSMFKNCKLLKELDVSNFDTSNVSDMEGMFESCELLTKLDVRGFNTGKVKKTKSMFSRCYELKELDVRGFHTSQVTDMSHMFMSCTQLKELDVSGFDTSQVTTMRSMFNGCESIPKLNVSNFDTSKVTNMSYMFSRCKLIKELDVSGFDTSKVTNMACMFNNCKLLEELNVSGFDTSKVTDMERMFDTCKTLKQLDISNFDTKNVTNSQDFIQNCTALEVCITPKTTFIMYLPTISEDKYWLDTEKKFYLAEHVYTFDKKAEIHCVKESYSIHYVADGELVNCPATYKVQEGLGELGTATNPNNPNSTFVGWYLDEAYTTPIKKIKKGTFGDITLYGKFVSNTFKITYKNIDGISNQKDLPNGYNYGTELEIPKATKDGFSFAGWFLDEACTKSFSATTKTTEGDLILYAKWEKNVDPTEQAIFNSGDNDVKGSSFSMIQARADKTTKNSIRLKWNKVKDADGYLVYGNKCGKKNKYELIKTIENGNTTTFTHKKIKKGTYYKYTVYAYKYANGKREKVAVSKTIHATTKGNKYGNAQSVKVNKTKVSLKKNKTFKLKCKEVAEKGKKLKKHRTVCYESSNTQIATVTKKGVIKAKKKGTCYVYAYAQNGVYKKIKVTVK